MNEILTADETAEMLRISVPYLRGLANSGELPAVRFGNDWRFLKDDLLQYVRERSKREQRERKFQYEQSLKEPLNILPRKRGRPRKHSIQNQ